ncbi:MAG: FHA domain-containing protein [Rhodoglobus sp.]
MTDGDDDGFIGLPPGMTAATELPTGTTPQNRAERSRTRRDVSFSSEQPGGPPFPAARDYLTVPLGVLSEGSDGYPGDGEAVSTTRSGDSSRHRAPSWRLVIEGQEAVVVEGKVYLGRNPVAPREHPEAHVLSLGSAAKSVSKTHAMIELDADVLWVHDLHSTNGVYIVTADQEAIEVTPDNPCILPAGADLELGETVVRILHD